MNGAKQKVCKHFNLYVQLKPNIINTLNKYHFHYSLIIATHRELLPPSSKKKAGSFKVGTERLKKYDAMLEEFPKNLETPIDAPFLRKVVRRKRQNDNKRLRLLEESLTPTKKTEVKVEVKPEVIEKPKKKRGPVQMSLTLPKKSSKFREVVFALNDFEKK